MLKKLVLAATVISVSALIFEGCVYHKADQEYPGCVYPRDTTGITYNHDIIPILNANCQPCHSPGNDISFINLYDYSTISSLALDGQFIYGTLLSAVMHEGGAPFMPQNGGKLTDCNINKIAAWVHDGAPQ
jgi:hypothetical protein